MKNKIFLGRLGIGLITTGFMLGGVILPVSAKGGTSGEWTEKIIVESPEGENVIIEEYVVQDGETLQTDSLPEDRTEEPLLALTSLTLNFDSSTGIASFTKEAALYYGLRLKWNGDNINGCGWQGGSSGNSYKASHNFSTSLVESGAYTLQLFSFTDKAGYDAFWQGDYSKAAGQSQVISFNYTKPSGKLSTPSKPTLKLVNNTTYNYQSVEIDFGTVEKAGSYRIATYEDMETYSRSYGESNSSSYEKMIRYQDSWYLEKGHDYRFTVIALSSNINKYLPSGESEKSDILRIDENGNISIVSGDGVIHPSGIKLNTNSLTLEKGGSGVISATVTPENAKDKTVTWSSSNTSVATVDSNGAIKAVGAGKANITAQTSNNLTATCVVTVIVKPTSIQLNQTSATLYYGQTLNLTATLMPADVTEKTITWTSSDSKIATVNGGVVKPTSAAAGKITVTAKTVNGLMAKCEVTVYADNNPSNPFADIKYGTWQFNSAMPVYDKGYMTGKGMLGDRIIFSPDTNINRSQFVVALYSMDGKPSVSYKQKFSDVSSKDWYASAVTWASDNGIVAGNPDGSFGVNGKATREQLALMFYKYAMYMNYDVSVSPSTTLDGFTDAAKVDSWAVTAIKWAVERGIISGKGNEKDGYRIDPTKGATRIECAAMMNKFDSVYSDVKLVLEAEEEPLALPMEEVEEAPVADENIEDVVDEDNIEDEDVAPADEDIIDDEDSGENIEDADEDTNPEDIVDED